MLDARVGLCAVSALLIHYSWRLLRRPKLHHPPSPLSLPFIGNLFSIPAGHEYLAFEKLGEQLESDIVYLEILGHKIIILNSAEAASEILDKRAAIYSDRPDVPMISDPALMNWPGNAVIIPYSDLWRRYRRMMNNWLNKRAVTQFDDLQDRQVRSLLGRLLRVANRDQPFEHVRDAIFFTMGSSMLQLAYGYKPKDSQDHFFQQAQVTVHNVTSAGMQTNFLVNLFPALLNVPDWFPGTGWKRTGRDWGAQQYKSKTEPYEWVKAQLANGTHQLSLLGALLQDHQLVSGLGPEEKDERLKEIGIVLFGAGSDTTSNFVVSVIAAMVLNPQVQARAQSELDAVLGPAVLPKISDKERLPYIRNLLDEVFRMYPVTPLAIPHACLQDDVFRGYNIQKGTTILGNIWAIGRDPRHYKNPEVFDPDRFLDPDVPRPPAFGWGRRKCPGIHFARASVFVTTASLLATFTFSKKKDSNGREIMPRIEVERNSIGLELKPFDFELKPRSEEHRQLILGASIDEERS